MYIYLILLIGLLLTATVDLIHPFNKKDANNWFWFWIVIFILFKGLRWDTGTDWAQFYACFEDSKWSNIFSYWRYGFDTETMEFGYVFLNVLGRTLLGHFTLFLLVTNAFILIVLGKLIKEHIPQHHIAVLAILLLSMEFFPVRQSLSIAIFCFSIPFILERNIKKFIICLLICFTIHRSSLLGIIAYPLINYNYKYKYNVLIYSVIFSLSTILYSAFDFLHSIDLINTLTGGLMHHYDIAEGYMKMESFENKSYLSTYISSVVQLSIFSYPYYHIMPKDSQYKSVYGFYLNLYTLWLCVNAIGYNPAFDIVFRVANMFAIAYPMVVGFTIFYFIKKKIEVLAMVILFGVFLIKLRTQTFMQPESDYYFLYVPYKSFIHEGEPERSGQWPFRHANQ